MARGGGLGGRGGIGGNSGRSGSAGRRAATSAARNTTKRPNRNTRNRNNTNERDRVRNEQAAEKELDSIITSSKTNKNLGRFLRSRLRGLGRISRNERKSRIELAKRELRNEAINNMKGDFDDLTANLPPGSNKSGVTRNGIYNQLEGGQRALVGIARDPMINVARGGGRGAQMYKAGIESHDAAFEAIGQTLRDIADAYDTFMDIGQSVINTAESNNN